MKLLDPRGPQPLAAHGTFNGHPLCMAAGCASLDMLDQPAIDRINGLGSNLLFINQAFSRTGPGQGPQNQRGGLLFTDVAAIRDGVAGVAGVSVEQQASVDVKVGNQTRTGVSVVGTTPDYTTVRDVKVGSGRWFTDQENQRTEKVARQLGSTATLGFEPFADAPVEHRPANVADALIEHVTVQGVGEAIAADDIAVAKRDDTVRFEIAQLMRFGLTEAFDLVDRPLQCRGHSGGGKFVADGNLISGKHPGMVDRFMQEASECRFIQSLKSFAASRLFDRTGIAGIYKLSTGNPISIQRHIHLARCHRLQHGVFKIGRQASIHLPR